MSKQRQNKSVDIYKLAEDLLNEIRPQVKQIEVTGSVRRKDPNANDLDFTIIPKDNVEIKLKDSVGINWSGPKKVQHVLKQGVTVDLLFTTPESWGAAILHFIGPKGYDIGLKMRAKKMGYKLNEYGLFNGDGKCIASKTEEEILNVLGKTWKSPELR